MAVGDVQRCPNWFHEEDCDACRKGRTTEQIHAACEFCEGSGFVTVIAEDDNSQTVKPRKTDEAASDKTRQELKTFARCAGPR